MFRKSLLFAAALLAGTSLGAQAGTVTALTKSTPFDGVIYGFLLTDGTLLFQGGLLQDFYRFKPDKKGSYVNGTLYPAASLPPNYIPYATSGGVLPDGRVVLIGGEYKLLSNNTLTLYSTNQMAVYDPRADKWTMIEPPSGPEWAFIGDSPWTLLPNGKLLLGHKFSKAMAELDPTTLKWTEVSSFAKDDIFAEEGLTLLPDGSVLTVNMTDVNKAQRYVPHSDPSKSRWDDAGSTPGRRRKGCRPSEIRTTQRTSSTTTARESIIRPARSARGSCGRTARYSTAARHAPSRAPARIRMLA
jgi:hypothetical protein